MSGPAPGRLGERAGWGVHSISHRLVALRTCFSECVLQFLSERLRVGFPAFIGGLGGGGEYLICSDDEYLFMCLYAVCAFYLFILGVNYLLIFNFFSRVFFFCC